ncbi:ATP synthase F1 subunit epsilon [soil metagenome]
MAHQFRLQIVTQQKTIFDRDITSLVLPGEDGYFGVLAQHAPIISVLKTGYCDIRDGNDAQRVEITGGFFEMSDNVATLLADSMTGLKIEAEEE